jgi:endonuclease YncB( thermonuclease family)
MTTFGPYPATVVSVHDADTCTLDVDCGFRITFRTNCRLFGCNAAELSTDAGKAARDYVAALLPVGAAVTVVSHGYDKYGSRIDGSITLADGRNLTAVLVAGQWAATWDGTGKAPVPPWPRTVTP